MAFIADKDGNLHDIDRASPACSIGPEGSRYEDGPAAFKAQAREIAANQHSTEQGDESEPLTIQHFCSYCLPGASWSDIGVKF